MHGFRQKERSGKDPELGGDVEGKYTRIYEDGINPFKEFQVTCSHWAQPGEGRMDVESKYTRMYQLIPGVSGEG